ncbi:hypothetical protein JDV02_001870 [Purpureocillium takamizusanense]|nr:uncharacterized protein JDV02_001870 [Purpureocillium takamizusanense]UNI15329.1 hypothetical protein JDV02_001870 [Purpureocillium takamizusanense]
MPPRAEDVAVIVSPMRRTLQTATLALDWLVDRGVRFEASADWQENSDQPCDTGSPLAAIAPSFPHVSFSDVSPLWPDKTTTTSSSSSSSPSTSSASASAEASSASASAAQLFGYTRASILARGRRALEALHARPERLVFVVSHSGFLRAGVCRWWFFNADYRIFDFDFVAVNDPAVSSEEGGEEKHQHQHHQQQQQQQARGEEDNRLLLRQHHSTDPKGGLGSSFAERVALGEGLPRGENGVAT